jgi:lysozyme family protein
MRFFLLTVFLSVTALGQTIPVDQQARWDAAKIRPQFNIALDKVVFWYQKRQDRYQAIQDMRPNGVPAPIAYCLHYRESDNDFTCHFHEGSPLTHRTRYEPKGRLPAPAEPPFTWQQSAEDAYYVCEHPTLDRINWHRLQTALDKMESFNGFGYRKRGIAAPYLWSGTTLYERGKYVKDGVFSAEAIDKQLGCVAILKRMQARGIPISFLRVDDFLFRKQIRKWLHETEG